MSSLDLIIDPSEAGQSGADELSARYAASSAADGPVISSIAATASGGLLKLSTKLKISFIDSMKNGCNPNAGHDEINFIHASDIAAAIDEWVKASKLTTQGFVLPGMFRTLNVGFNVTPTFFSGAGVITNAATPVLEQAIKAELDISILTASDGSTSPQQIADQLGTGMASAMLAYAKSCVCVFLGSNLTPYFTSGMLPAITPELMRHGEKFGGGGTGGTALGLTALEPSVPVLASSISQAYMRRGELGSQDNADSVQVANVWANDMANAILVFFSSSVVIGTHIFKGGATKLARFGPGTSLMAVPPSPVPTVPTMPPAVTVPGATAIGTGTFN